MQTHTVSYAKCFNWGNYEHEKRAVEVRVDEGDNVQEIIKQARNYVEIQSQPFQAKVEGAERVVANPDDYTGSQVKQAQSFLDQARGMATPKLTEMSESSG